MERNEECKDDKCKESKCAWRIYGRWLSNISKWQIVSLNNKHTCKRVYKNSQATSTWLTNRYLQRIKDNPKWPISAFKRTIFTDLKLDVHEFQVYGARKKVIKLIEGNYKEQYWQLWDYCHIIMACNPNS